MNIKFDSYDAGFLASRDMQMVALNLQFRQFLLQPARVDPQVNKRADKHIAADSAENVEIQGLHIATHEGYNVKRET